MPEDATNSLRPRSALLLCVVTALAGVGFFVGVRPRPEPPPAAAQREVPLAGGIPARSNAELVDRPWSTERPRWTAPRDVPELVPATDTAARATSLERREGSRAFEGAPPAIPHPIGHTGVTACRSCHEQGATIAGLRAPPMSHELLTSCTQCHALGTSQIPGEGEGLEVASTFAALRASGERAERWGQAPPPIPHTTQRRERCEACHGALGTPGLQTSHPERQSCTQCHAPSALREQRAT